MSTKFFFLDTNAIVKLFVQEKGHDIMRRLISSNDALIYSIQYITSTHVREEFPQTISKMTERGSIPSVVANGILIRSRGYFLNTSSINIIDLEDPPGFHNGNNTTADELLNKYSRRPMNITDYSKLASIINYLRCCAGPSLPHVITSDQRFSHVITKEGYRVLDPEKLTVDELKQYLCELEGEHVSPGGRGEAPRL